MAENQSQPKEYDAVLGGQAHPPIDGLVLGGIEGVNRRLTSATIEQKVIALQDALKYGEAGLDLVIQALQDQSEQVKKAAFELLLERAEPRVKQILQNYNLYVFFECFFTFKQHSIVFIKLSDYGDRTQ
ncbi:hypothetical protein [Nostoc sp.]|uniref:hypothetical protein n=2 Tax=unclassified Nostoc TaxID=2593658 RepID=UPI002FFD5404